MDFESLANFIKKLYSSKEIISLHEPLFLGNEKKYLENCIDSGYVSSVGSYVNDFEKSISDYTKCKNAILCLNGTNSIHICLQLAGVKKGDEVITQALSFVATANAIIYSNADPVFVDVEKNTMGMCPNDLEKFLNKNTYIKGNECFNKNTGKRIKACLPAHILGRACRIDEIHSICEKFHIELIEDAAEGMGSFYKGKHLGNFGRLAAISFNGNKIITTGGGGVILTDDDELAKKAKHLTTQAKTFHEWEYNHDEIGYNYRMPNINAAVGLAQLEKINCILEIKRNIHKSYTNFFKQNNLEFFSENINEQSNLWLNAIILESIDKRNDLLKFLHNKKIMARPLWNLISSFEMYKKYQKSNLINSKWLLERVVTLPSGCHNLVQ